MIPRPRVQVRQILVLTCLATAFGYIEGVVVVYLREIFYPEGFHFPIVPIPDRLLWIEKTREAATIVLLWATAYLAAPGGTHRFGALLLCFGVWDLVYYLTLKLLVDWPASLMEWDILFLIPKAWTSPVLAPVLASVALIGVGLVLLRSGGREEFVIRPLDWAIESVAGLLVIASFLWCLPDVTQQRVPDAYPWGLFAAGLLGGVGWFLYRWRARAR